MGKPAKKTPAKKGAEKRKAAKEDSSEDEPKRCKYTQVKKDLDKKVQEEAAKSSRNPFMTARRRFDTDPMFFQEQHIKVAKLVGAAI